MFTAVEAAVLKPLPRKPFELAAWSTGTHGPDIHVKVGKALYSAPWRLIGEKLDARATWNIVQLFHKGQLVATHIRADKGKRTDMEHYPPEKVAFAMKTPVWCRRRSREIGPSCTAVIGELLEVNALFRLRSAQGVLGLADNTAPYGWKPAAPRPSAPGSVLPHHQGHPGRRPGDRTRTPASAGDGGASARLHGQAALFDVDNVYPLVRREDVAA